MPLGDIGEGKVPLLGATAPPCSPRPRPPQPGRSPHRAQLHRAAAGSPPRDPRPATTAATANRPGRSPPPCPITPRCFTLPPHRAAAPTITATRALTTTVPNCTPCCSTVPRRAAAPATTATGALTTTVPNCTPRCPTLPHRAAAPATTATANRDARRTPHPCPINYTTLPRRAVAHAVPPCHAVQVFEILTRSSSIDRRPRST